MRKKLDDFVAAVGFLTTLPVRVRTAWDDRGKLAWFPVVGVLIGLGLWGVDTLGLHYLTRPGRAVFDLVYLVIVSGGLHLDGLADAADGLCSRRSREEMLVIMKDPRTGVFGVVAVVLVMAVKGAALLTADDPFGTLRPLTLVLAPAFARAAMLAGLETMAYVRPGTGIASGLVPARRTPWTMATILLPLVGAFAALVLPGDVPTRTAVRLGFMLVLTATGVTAAWLAICRNRIGGVTGDTLGALGELVEAVVLFTLCVQFPGGF
ncbi:MAG: adenosylcobinamide-GDP ribazoletransferase [Planctomycetota bacterium]